MSISKKIRFEVFKRDGFTCAYCGKTPPGVTLEVDHIEPKSKGGPDDINNLITACFDCNRGKSAIPLDKIPNQLIDNKEILVEKELQLKEYRKLVAKINRRISKDVDEIAEIYEEWFEGWTLTEKCKRNTIKRFLSLLPKSEIKDALDLACSKLSDRRSDAISYFCGICWNKIKKVPKPWEDKK